MRNEWIRNRDTNIRIFTNDTNGNEYDGKRIKQKSDLLLESQIFCFDNLVTIFVIPARELESTSVINPRGSRVPARDDEGGGFLELQPFGWVGSSSDKLKLN
jgi:hypothetical protein